MPGQGLNSAPTPEPVEIKEFKALLDSGIIALEAKFTANQESFAARPDIVRAFDEIEQIPQTLRRSVDEFIAESASRSSNPKIIDWVYRGFPMGYLHRILRAELSLTSYPSEDPNWQRIAECVHEAGEFIRSLAIPAGYELQSPRLFDPPPEGAAIDFGEEREYRQIPEIKSHVKNLILSQGKRGFVVSVLVFPFSLEGKKYSEGRVVIANPSDWL